jgi:hypothetical protein
VDAVGLRVRGEQVGEGLEGRLHRILRDHQAEACGGALRRSRLDQAERDVPLRQPLGQGHEVGGPRGLEEGAVVAEVERLGLVGGRLPGRGSVLVLEHVLELAPTVGTDGDLRPVLLAAVAAHADVDLHERRF